MGALASIALGLAALPALAETPADTLVMAKNIDDIITLDPAEVFELSGGEMINQLYDRIMVYEAEDTATLTGGVAESHTVSDDGRTITLKIRPDLTFHSGNPLTAEDVAFSLQRVIKLNLTPAFIFTQFGWSADNVEDMVNAVDAQRSSSRSARTSRPPSSSTASRPASARWWTRSSCSRTSRTAISATSG
jgi:peptide/nickel transport system substrate-binding protein